MKFFHPIHRLVIIPLLLSLFTVTAHCGIFDDDEDDNVLLLGLLALTLNSGVCPGGTVELSGNISSDTTIDCANLNGIVEVDDGATLTINARSIIYGKPGSALVIRQGGKLVASGTAESPIIFTSSKSEGERSTGDWGGIVISGKANGQDGTTASNVPGLGSSTTVNYAGFSNDNDDSGSLEYVRIEFAGEAIETGQELGCLSMYTVGRGTTIDHVQCNMSRGDSFRWVGGAVNATHLVSSGAGANDFDVDEGYNGNLQFLVAHKYRGGQSGISTTTPRGLEWDGETAAGVRNSQVQARNITLIGSFASFDSGVTVGVETTAASYWRDELSNTRLENVLVWGFGNSSGTSASLHCDSDVGAGNVLLNVFGAVGSNVDETGSNCGTIAGGTSTTNATSSPITTVGDPANGTNPNFIPTGGAASGPAITSAGNNSYTFAAASYYGGVDPASDWTSGWTDYSNN